MSACAASAASADVITFDHGAAKLAALPQPVTIVEPADPLVINNVTYGPDTSFATAAPGDFDFTPYSGSAGGVQFTVDIAPLAAVTGSFDPATGAMTTDSINYATTVTVGPPENATCTYTTSFAFSTESAKVIFGDRFDALAPPPVNGAIVGIWEGVPGDPKLGCTTINNRAREPGAFWFSNGIAAPALVPVAKKCKKGLKPKKGAKKGVCVCKNKKQRTKKGACSKKRKKNQGSRRRG